MIKLNAIFSLLNTILFSICFINLSCSQNTIKKKSDLRDLGITWHPTKSQLKAMHGKNTDPSRVRDFANYSAIYAIPSVAVYDIDKNKEEVIPFPKFEKWKELLARDTGIDKKRGFAARAWLRTKRDKSQELVIAYRGTTSFKKDFYYANLVPLTAALVTNQYDLAYEYAKKAQTKLGKKYTNIPIILTGHSLGGGLAEYVQRLLPGSKSITFDTSPNHGRLYSLFKKKTNERESVRIYEKGEILSFFRYLISADLKLDQTPEGLGLRAARFDFYRGYPWKQHGIHDLCMALLRVSASTGQTEALDVIKQIELKRDHLTLPALNKNNFYRRKIRNEILSKHYRK